MAFRGRGRGGFGRGRGHGSIFETQLGKHVPYDDFPDLPDGTLPDLPDLKLFPDLKALKASRVNLERFWRGSCYYLEDPTANSKNQETEIERFSDRFKDKTQGRRRALASFLNLTSSNFPLELIHGSKRVQHVSKKLRLEKESGEKLLDVFEKLEEGSKGKDDKATKEKKDENEEEEDAEEQEEEASEEDDDDYNQNIDFDDDEDDLNMEEEGHEDVYE